MIKYQYQVLRYLHDQFTGEFGNIGVVLYAPQNNYLHCKVTNRYSRLSDFFGDVNGQFLVSSIKHFEISINRMGENIKGLFPNLKQETDLSNLTSQILPKDDSALQLTEVTYGLDLDPEHALDDLFERIIEKYNTEGHATHHTDYYAWRKVYKDYFDKYGLTGKLKKFTAETAKDKINFDKAWKNGVWNCYQPLSFDLKEVESIKSKVYKWSGIIKALETSKEELHVYFLTTSPSHHEDLQAFIHDTLTMKDKILSVEVVQEENADAFAAQVYSDMVESKHIRTDEDELF
jgi:Protein of unknown function (DUF3037)